MHLSVRVLFNIQLLDYANTPCGCLPIPTPYCFGYLTLANYGIHELSFERGGKYRRSVCLRGGVSGDSPSEPNHHRGFAKLFSKASIKARQRSAATYRFSFGYFSFFRKKKSNWYPERDLNPYSRRKQILSLLRLPIPPSGHRIKYNIYHQKNKINQFKQIFSFYVAKY